MDDLLTQKEEERKEHTAKDDDDDDEKEEEALSLRLRKRPLAYSLLLSKPTLLLQQQRLKLLLLGLFRLHIYNTLFLSRSLSLATAFTLLNSALFLLPGTKKGEIFSSLSIKRIVLYRLCLPPIMPKSIVPLEAVGSTDSVTNREVTGGASSALRWEMGGGGGGWTGTTVGGTFWVGYMMMM